jgi:hypothetical protein
VSGSVDSQPSACPFYSICLSYFDECWATRGPSSDGDTMERRGSIMVLQ